MTLDQSLLYFFGLAALVGGVLMLVAQHPMRVALALIAVRLNSCFSRFKPPRKSERPRTKRRLPTIEPVIDALTTFTSPAWRAKTAMISSVALPKVALSLWARSAMHGFTSR